MGRKRKRPPSRGENERAAETPPRRLNAALGDRARGRYEIEIETRDVHR
jgi:hypothetical protein